MSYKLIQESLLSNKDIYHQFDKWEDGFINVLCIAGIGGSGKSTLSKKLAKQNKCDFIELDVYRNEYIYEMLLDKSSKLNNDQIKYIKRHKGSHASILFDYLINIDKSNLTICKMISFDFINNEIPRLLHSLKNKTIIEGIWFIFMNDKNIYDIKNNYACIIMNTGDIKSAWRGMIRDSKKNELNSIMDHLRFMSTHIKYLINIFKDKEMSDSIKRFKKIIIN